jgi:peptidoglycan/LPS O-acetylase OafA/YrhL
MKTHFKGLDTLRAIAALVVVIGHIELIKSTVNFPNLLNHPYIRLADGHIGVVLFFVLSGFLITYLLIKEKVNTGKIAIKKFYLRRICRIWPLYYLVLVLSFLIFRADYRIDSIILCVTIFPNVAHALGIDWPTSAQIWSIGVEEQFYLFWPLIISIIPYKKTVPFLIIFFIGYSLLPHFIGFINVRTFESEALVSFSNKFFYGTNFNSMCIGSILGFMYATQHKNLKWLYNKYISYSAIFLSFCLWFSRFELKYFTTEFYSIIFGIMILNVATNSKLKLNLDIKVFSFLGKISYGIYMYHWIIILLAIKFFPYSSGDNIYLYNLLLYLMVLITTIGVSWISYISFEKFFLNIKVRYEKKSHY